MQMSKNVTIDVCMNPPIKLIVRGKFSLVPIVPGVFLGRIHLYSDLYCRSCHTFLTDRSLFFLSPGWSVMVSERLPG